MSEVLAFAALGLRHILDPRGLDHVLFIVVLACGYRVGDWRGILWVVTAFTTGHSITLAMSATGMLRLPARLIETLIPLTIVIAGIQGVTGTWPASGRSTPLRPLLAGGFGLVHGAGFANYLRSLFVDDLALPLLGFNLGLEAGQIATLAVALIVFAAMDALLGRLRAGPSALGLRRLAVSSAVTMVGAVWTYQRAFI